MCAAGLATTGTRSCGGGLGIGDLGALDSTLGGGVVEAVCIACSCFCINGFACLGPALPPSRSSMETLLFSFGASILTLRCSTGAFPPSRARIGTVAAFLGGAVCLMLGSSTCTMGADSRAIRDVGGFLISGGFVNSPCWFACCCLTGTAAGFGSSTATSTGVSSSG